MTHREVTVIADDLTGAADCAAAFAFSLATSVCLDHDPGDAGVDAVAVDTDSRGEGVDTAIARTRAAAALAMRWGSRVLYKKIDSTLRGHIGAETAAALAVMGEGSSPGRRPIVLMSAAFPATGRTMRSGRVLVGGAPLDAMPVALLEAAGLRAVGVAAAGAGSGPKGLAGAIARLAAEGVDAIVGDASCDADLRAFADAGAHLSRPVLWAGSGGLARHLTEALGLRAHARSGAHAFETTAAALAAAGGPTLVLVGARTAIAHAQAAEIARDGTVGTIVVPRETLLAGVDGPGWRAAAADVARTLRAGDACVVIEPHGTDSDRVDRELAGALGRLSAVPTPIGALVATGGDTARAALRARGIEGFRLLGEIEAGVPLGIAEGASGAEARPPLRIVTKAGGFGDLASLARACASLRTLATRSVAR